MIESREYQGDWKVPNNDIWYNGTLTYSPETGARLKLFGSFKEHFFDYKTKKIIVGRTNEGEITLINSNHKKTSNGQGITTAIYEPSIIIEGVSVSKDSELFFSSAVFRAHNLFQWFDLSGLQENIPHWNSKEYIIKYKSVENIEFIINKNLSGYISFDAPLITNGVNNRIELYEQAYVHFQYSAPSSYSKILTDISKFINFLTLTTYEQSYPTSIKFLDQEATLKKLEGKEYDLVSCVYKHTRYSALHKIRRPYYHILSFQDVSIDFPNIIRKWYSLHDKMDSTIFLLMIFFRNKYLFSEDRFMECIRAIESFHRIKYGSTKLTKAEYEGRVSDIITNSGFEGEKLNWLRAKLMGNEPSLGMRLEDLIQDNLNSYTLKNLTSQVCTDAKNSRNYYTHFHKSGEKRALKGTELFLLTKKLRGLLISAIFTELNINKKKFEEKLNYHLD